MYHETFLHKRFDALTEQQRKRLEVIDRRINWRDYHQYTQSMQQANAVFGERLGTSVHSIAAACNKIAALQQLVQSNYSPVYPLLEALITCYQRGLRLAAELPSQTADVGPVLQSEEHRRKLLPAMLELEQHLVLVELELQIDPEPEKQ